MADQFEWLVELDPERLAWLHKDKLINIIQQVNSAGIMEIHNRRRKKKNSTSMRPVCKISSYEKASTLP